MHGAPCVQSLDRGALQGFRYRRGVRNHGNADVRLEKLDQVALGRDFVAAIDIEPMLAQRTVDPLGMLTIAARQQLLVSEILEPDIIPARQRMPSAHGEFKSFGEQRPDVEALPVAAELGRDAEFGFAVLELFADLPGITAQAAE